MSFQGNEFSITLYRKEKENITNPWNILKATLPCTKLGAKTMFHVVSCFGVMTLQISRKFCFSLMEICNVDITLQLNIGCIYTVYYTH